MLYALVNHPAAVLVTAVALLLLYLLLGALAAWRAVSR